jgi:hypothetical protein
MASLTDKTKSTYNPYPEYLYGDVKSEQNVDLLQSDWKIDFPTEKLAQVHRLVVRF